MSRPIDPSRLDRRGAPGLLGGRCSSPPHTPKSHRAPDQPMSTDSISYPAP